MSDQQRDIILLSTADWDNPFWTNKQHVAVELAKRGYRVFYIDSLGLRRPSASGQDINRIFKRLSRMFKGPRRVRDNVWVWSPFVIPFQGYSFVRSLNRFLLSATLRLYMRRMGLSDEILWTYNPLTVNLLPLKGFKKVIYHCVDEIKAQPGMPADILERAEAELIKRADLIFTTSKKLTETRRVLNQNTHYFSNVADFDHFSKARDAATIVPDDLMNIPTPRIGFIGAISGYKVDFDLLRFIADKRPDWSVILIGKVGEGDPWTDTSLFEGLKNIFFMGSRAYSELPAYLKGIDVAILPNKLNDYTESMFPMKFFEYLASGKPVVSVDLPALHDFRNVVYLARSPQDFVTGIDEALKENISPIEERLSVAKENTYEIRMDKMLKLVESLYLENRTFEL